LEGRNSQHGGGGGGKKTVKGKIRWTTDIIKMAVGRGSRLAEKREREKNHDDYNGLPAL